MYSDIVRDEGIMCPVFVRSNVSMDSVALVSRGYCKLRMSSDSVSQCAVTLVSRARPTPYPSIQWTGRG